MARPFAIFVRYLENLNTNLENLNTNLKNLNTYLENLNINLQNIEIKLNHFRLISITMEEKITVIVPMAEKKIHPTEVVERLRSILGRLWATGECITCGWVEWANEMYQCSDCNGYICRRCFGNVSNIANTEQSKVICICGNCKVKLDNTNKDEKTNTK